MKRSLLISTVLLCAWVAGAAGYYRQLLMLPRAAAVSIAQLPIGYADMVIDFEAGAIGSLVDSNTLDACTYQIRPWGRWLMVTNQPSLSFAPQASSYQSDMRVGSTTVSSNGNVSFKAQTSNALQRATFNFGGKIGNYPTNVSVGFYLTTQEHSVDGESSDILTLSKNGAFCIANVTNGCYLTVHTGAGKSTGIQLASSTTYWVSMLSAMAGNCHISAYTTGGSLVGTNYLVQPNSTNGHDSLYIGRCDNTGNRRYDFTYIDNLCVDFTDASYPLGITTNPLHEVTLDKNYIVAEDFQKGYRPGPFYTNQTAVKWDNISLFPGNPIAPSIASSTEAIGINLMRSYSNLYSYFMFYATNSINSRYTIDFGSTSDTSILLGMRYTFSKNLQLYGATNATSGGVYATGVVYHCWLEYENISAVASTARCYIATTATKPSVPTMAGVCGGASFTNAPIRYVRLRDGGVTFFNKFRLSRQPIGSNPQ
jgi:hypothetical protein